jgi:cell division transport system permease protein
MAQFGKASVKRGKPSYVYAVIGVSLVLFLFGIIGWIALTVRMTGNYFKETIPFSAYLYRTANAKQIDTVKNAISTLPYVRSAEYISKEKALEKYNAANDTNYRKLGIENPLPASIDFKVKAQYMEKDSVANMETYLMNTFPNLIMEIQSPQETISKVGRFVQTSTLIISVLTIILTILVLISIDNTIRLQMYSNRFLIKTKQMVGATRWFIAKPLDGRAVVNGLIASGVAIGLLTLFIMITEKVVPEIKVVHNTENIFILYAGMIFLGVFMTFFSTHRAVIKYLKLKLDDLY